MACLPARDSIVKEPECEDVVSNMASRVTPRRFSVVNIEDHGPPPQRSECCIDMPSCFRACTKEPECEDAVVKMSSSLTPIGSSILEPKHVINSPPPLEQSECCIYRVPKQLRKVNKQAYTPKHVSIGPFHHGRKELSGMEIHKQSYSTYFFDERNPKKSKEDLLKIIIDNGGNICNCYSDKCRLEGKEFANMILLDAIFIIELFLREREKKMDYISSKPWLAVGIKHDLILLENQLPFFVLEKLYEVAINDSSGCNHCKEGKLIVEHVKDPKKADAPCFFKLSCDYFSQYVQHGIGEEVTTKLIDVEVKHFTDLLRNLFCSPVPHLFRTNEQPLHTRYSAKKLDDAGLKFKAPKKKPLLKIQFHQNRCWCFDCSCLLSCLQCFKCFPFLEVSCLQIDDYTEAFFRNLMALEQCHYPNNAYICNYVILLDRLINTEEDVDLLVKNKVIDNMLGSNAAVATLINKLGDQIVVTPSPYFNDIAQNLNAHYEFIWYQIWATLKREYFPNIFRGTATILGLIVLGFTLWSFIRPYVMKT